MVFRNDLFYICSSFSPRKSNEEIKNGFHVLVEYKKLKIGKDKKKRENQSSLIATVTTSKKQTVRLLQIGLGIINEEKKKREAKQNKSCTLKRRKKKQHHPMFYIHQTLGFFYNVTYTVLIT